MSYKRPILKILFCVFLLLSVCLTLTASADEKEPSKSAFEITQNCVITLNEKNNPGSPHRQSGANLYQVQGTGAYHRPFPGAHWRNLPEI